MKLIRQPEESSLCGQACVAMAAGVTLEEAIEAVGHRRKRGTLTREVVAGLRSFGLKCADRARKVSRIRPVFPKRAVLALRKPKPNPDGKKNYESGNWHWLLVWDGEVYDPSGLTWPDDYKGWRVTSYLGIFE